MAWAGTPRQTTSSMSRRSSTCTPCCRGLQPFPTCPASSWNGLSMSGVQICYIWNVCMPLMTSTQRQNYAMPLVGYIYTLLPGIAVISYMPGYVLERPPYVRCCPAVLMSCCFATQASCVQDMAASMNHTAQDTSCKPGLVLDCLPFSLLACFSSKQA